MKGGRVWQTQQSTGSIPPIWTRSRICTTRSSALSEARTGSSVTCRAGATCWFRLRIGNDAVGFYIGMELRPTTHQGWIVGVVPEMRRAGIGTQLLVAAADWAKTEGYRSIRFEVPNTVRSVLQFSIAEGYDITGVRYDHDLATNLVIFERVLGENGYEG
ncbi:MAG: GNAT family N-acetyltransferase [Phycisphaerales bacterium]